MLLYTAADLFSLRPGRGRAQVLCPLPAATVDRVQSLGLRRRRGVRAGHLKQRKIEVISSRDQDGKHQHKQPRPLPTAKLSSNANNLVHPPLQRHCVDHNKQLVFGAFNARSVRNTGRADAVRQLRVDNAIDVLFLTETWHETADDVSLRRLRTEGLQVLELSLIHI